MPLTILADRTLLLDTQHPRFAAARDAIAPFAELEKSPDRYHSYRVTRLSLWSAAAAGLPPDAIVARLADFSGGALPDGLASALREVAGRWGRLRLERAGAELRLTADSPALLTTLARRAEVAALLGEPRGPLAVAVDPEQRGTLKRALVVAGWPVDDQAGYEPGEALPLRLQNVVLRDYQRAAAEAFFAAGAARGGSGVIVLPPGAGKTIVGLAAMALVGQATLVLTSSRTSVAQWRRELLARSDLDETMLAEYTGERKGVAPVTLSTYQMLTSRSSAAGSFPHMQLLSARGWGLIVYDEVHLLPAPVFRTTAAIQARRRLGLTATLVREDGREGDVFALIGPKRYEAPWRALEAQGWIAPARCTEVRVGLPEDERRAYALAQPRERPRIAAENPAKIALLRAVLARHPGAPTLVIGQYLDQLRRVAAALEAPLISGATPQAERERHFAAFRRGEPGAGHHAPLLVVSRVGNLALDLPDAELVVQLSGSFGSRQEEAQRLGRVLRPKPDGRAAHFYTLVTRDTVELEFAHRRQIFLAEQGYDYLIAEAHELLGSPAAR